MTLAATRRLAKLEGALGPREAVLAWLAEAQRFPGLVAHARSIAELPVEAAPLSVIGTRVEAAVRDAMKGRTREDTERAVQRAVGDAVFLFCLVFILNGQALDVARVEGLRATAAFYWMGALLGGPHDPPESDEDAREQQESWQLWRSVVERLGTDARVETETRESLERRYFAGHDVLFADASTAWTDHVDMVNRLGRLADTLASARIVKGTQTRSRARGATDAIRARIEALAGRLADDARIRGYEVLGDRERAVTIMERRLLGA